MDREHGRDDCLGRGLSRRKRRCHTPGMLRATAHQVKQLTQRASLIALTGFAFSVGVGVGALAFTAQFAEAMIETVVASNVPPAFEYEQAAVRVAGTNDPPVVPLQVVATPPPPAPEETVAMSARRFAQPGELPGASVPLYGAALVQQMVPGERVAAPLTFYYCSGTPVGDGGGF